MDARLRALQRAYLADPVGSNLLALLQEYARAGQTPEGDIEALSLVNKYPDWQMQFNRDTAQTLVELGYPMGVYFHLKVTTSGSMLGATLALSHLISAIYSGFERKAHVLSFRLHVPGGEPDLDSIDSYDVSGGNSIAREILEDGRPRYRHNIDKVNAQLLAIPPGTAAIMERFSAQIIPPVTKKGQTTVTYRIFIPVIELERAYWTQFITTQGMSRSTRRERGKSTIDWGTKSQVKALQAALFSDVNGWVQRLDTEENLRTTTTKLGVNLLLGLSCYWHFRTHSWLS